MRDVRKAPVRGDGGDRAPARAAGEIRRAALQAQFAHGAPDRGTLQREGLVQRAHGDFQIRGHRARRQARLAQARLDHVHGAAPQIDQARGAGRRARLRGRREHLREPAADDAQRIGAIVGIQGIDVPAQLAQQAQRERGAAPLRRTRRREGRRRPARADERRARQVQAQQAEGLGMLQHVGPGGIDDVDVPGPHPRAPAALLDGALAREHDVHEQAVARIAPDLRLRAGHPLRQ